MLFCIVMPEIFCKSHTSGYLARALLYRIMSATKRQTTGAANMTHPDTDGNAWNDLDDYRAILDRMIAAGE